MVKSVVAVLACAPLLIAVGVIAPATAQTFSGAPIEMAIVYGGKNNVLPYPGNPTMFDTHGGVENSGVSAIFTFSGNTLTVRHIQGASYSTSFNGWRLRDVGNYFADFTNVKLTSNIAGLTQDDVSFDKDNIWLDQADVQYVKGDTYTLTVETAASAVPEAGTWAMVITGFGAAGGTLRSRRPKRKLFKLA